MSKPCNWGPVMGQQVAQIAEASSLWRGWGWRVAQYIGAYNLGNPTQKNRPCKTPPLEPPKGVSGYGQWGGGGGGITSQRRRHQPPRSHFAPELLELLGTLVLHIIYI